MAHLYQVKGIDPLGRIVEFALQADTEIHAKATAESVGLRFVTVARAEPSQVTESLPPPPPDPPG